MKNRLNAFVYTAAIVLITSCSTSRSAMAQSPNDQYDNGTNQQQPPPQDNQNYNNGQNNDQTYNNDQGAQNDQDYDSQNYTNDDNGNQNYDGQNDQANGYNQNDQGNDYNQYGNGYNQNYNGSSALSQNNVTINDFNSALSPYGTWMDYPSYGRVWVCRVPGFRPYYSSGHWVYTNFGWTWASDYSWGWAPFHYGRWAFEAAYGWMWVPGYQWGPAWVGWRSGGAYYGWAPLNPGIQIGFGTGYGGYGYLPSERWCFVQSGYIGSPYLNRYYVNPRRNITIIRNTTIINNIHQYGGGAIVNGPSRMDVERATGRSIQPMHVINATRPGGTAVIGGNVSIYRPHTTQVNMTRPNTINSVRPNTQQQLQGNMQQRNINNLPQRGSINQPPANQNFQQPSRPTIQPQQQQVQPQRQMPGVRPGAVNQPQRNYTPQVQRSFSAPQPQMQRSSEPRQFAQSGNFNSGSARSSGGVRRR